MHPRHVRLESQSYANRREREPWRALYDTATWKRARLDYMAHHPLCAMCAQQGRDTLADAVDHIQPHRGDTALFWDTRNWQALCHRCHGRKTGAEVQKRKVE